MKNSELSGLPFFPAAKVNSQKTSNPNPQTNPKEETDEFSSTLDKATDTRAKQGSQKVMQKNIRMDKPKLNHREPFFPMTPMPYHPEPEELQAMVQAQENLEGLESVDSESAFVMPLLSDVSYVPQTPNDIETSDSASASAVQMADLSQAGFMPKDDTAGIMNRSYDGAVVSYPIKRIAPQIDDDVRKSLEEQGLWDLPTTVMAQPNPQLAMMNQQLDVAREPMPAVPVQKPVLKFMASMENELGISRDRLVDAFEKLPPGALQLPPEKTMEKVIQNLNLPAEEQQKAVGFYSEMLSEMKTIDTREQKPVVLTVPTAASMVRDSEAKQVLAQDAALKYSKQGSEKKQVVSSDIIDSKPVVSAKPMQDSAMPKNLMQAESPQQNMNQNLNQQGFGENNFFSNEKSNTAKNLSDTKTELSKAEVKQSIHPHSAPIAHDLKPLQGSDVVSANTLVNEVAPGQQQQSRVEMQSIVRNAQLLAKQGGGEMTMTLKPETLGEIQLKVVMDGHRVDVQMVTERSEVKKLIEQNVSELRHGLATQNLSMEKLDVSLNQKDLSNMNHRNHDFNSARDFSNQLHQQNQNRREFFGDSRGLFRNPEIKRPTMVSTASVKPGSRRTSGSSRLDIVA